MIRESKLNMQYFTYNRIESIYKNSVYLIGKRGLKTIQTDLT